MSRLVGTALGSLCVALVAAMLLSACGGGGGQASGASEGSNAAGATAAPGLKVTTPAAEIPSEATVAYNQNLTTLDPDLAVGQTDVNVINLIGGRLYESDGEGKPQPSLAESGEASSNGLKWTFQLRPGLTFSDGSKLSAPDVQATFERALTDKSNVQAALYAPIKSVSASGPRTVVFTLKHPYPDLPGMLAEEFAMVLPAKEMEEANFFDHPVSAGPYLLKSVQGHDVTLEVNPHYYGPKPAIKTLKLVTIEDPNSRLAQLKSGQIDFAFDLPPSLLPTLENTSGVTASVVPGYGWYSLDMWNKSKPLDDPKVRRAISMAINREQLAEVIWQGKNQGLSSFWPETMAGYDSSQSTAAEVEAAKEELAGTECAGGCTIELEYPPALVPFADQMVLLISSDLEAIGIKVTITKVDFNTFYADLGDGKYQMALYGLYDFVNMPDGLLTYALAAEGGINANFSGYSSPAATKLIDRTLQSSGAEQTKALGEVNETFAKDQPFATLATWAYVPATRLPADLMSVQGSGLLYVGSTE